MIAEDSTHVLIAEDDDDDYYLFSIAIAETSYKVLLSRAENGEILLRLLQSKNLPNIVFLDMLMPVLDGQKCLKAIRSDKRYDGIPIIVYSSLKDLECIEYCFREGSNLFVMKPDTYADLKKILERILAIDWKKTMYYPTRAEFVLRAS